MKTLIVREIDSDTPTIGAVKYEDLVPQLTEANIKEALVDHFDADVKFMQAINYDRLTSKGTTIVKIEVAGTWEDEEFSDETAYTTNIELDYSWCWGF